MELTDIVPIKYISDVSWFPMDIPNPIKRASLRSKFIKSANLFFSLFTPSYLDCFKQTIEFLSTNDIFKKKSYDDAAVSNSILVLDYDDIMTRLSELNVSSFIRDYTILHALLNTFVTFNIPKKNFQCIQEFLDLYPKLQKQFSIIVKTKGLTSYSSTIKSDQDHIKSVIENYYQSIK